ncbi:MAG: phosphotransferase [Kiritimatiellia bacterium]
MNVADVSFQFQVAGRQVMVNPTGSGNVNDTYLAIFRTTFSEERFIVQRINKRVFKRPEWVMLNIRILTEHVHNRLETARDTADRIWQLPRIIPCKDGRDFFIDEHGEFWRAMTLIASAKAYTTTQGSEHAMECGTVLGHFHNLISDLDPARLNDTLPGFHITPLYLVKYRQTLASSEAQNILRGSAEARRLALFVEAHTEMAGCLERAREQGVLGLRLIHGDPKVTNIMIDDFTGKGTSIIDLDTVKPGLIHYDFGDALRSTCNPAGEDVENLNEVVFDVDLCEAFIKGYMVNADRFLTPGDRAHLFDAIRLLAFELGLRFFEDYLAGDVYFKVKNPEQNLIRARVQFKLCESIEAREKQIRAVLESTRPA